VELGKLAKTQAAFVLANDFLVIQIETRTPQALAFKVRTRCKSIQTIPRSVERR
jgi:hypothetical protein